MVIPRPAHQQRVARQGCQRDPWRNRNSPRAGMVRQHLAGLQDRCLQHCQGMFRLLATMCSRFRLCSQPAVRCQLLMYFFSTVNDCAIIGQNADVGDGDEAEAGHGRGRAGSPELVVDA
jgi:hypothetical protein